MRRALPTLATLATLPTVAKGRKAAVTALVRPVLAPLHENNVPADALSAGALSAANYVPLAGRTIATVTPVLVWNGVEIAPTDLDENLRGDDRVQVAIDVTDSAGATVRFITNERVVSRIVLTVATAPAVTWPSAPAQARIGDTLTISGDTWNGLPPGEIISREYQWRRGETPIAGATSASYQLTADDDQIFTAGFVRVRAAGAETVSSWMMATPPVTPLYTAPIAIGSLNNVTATQSGTPASVAGATVAAAFSTTPGVYSLASGGPSDTIDPATGAISLPLTTTGSRSIVVRKSNSGGSADVGFTLTVNPAGGVVADTYKAASIGGSTGTSWNTGAMLAGETLVVILRANSATLFVETDCAFTSPPPGAAFTPRYLSADNDTHCQAVWTYKAIADHPSGLAITTRSAFASIVNVGRNDFAAINTLMAGTSTTFSMPVVAQVLDGKTLFFLSRRSGTTTISTATPALPAASPTLPAAAGYYANGTLAHMWLTTPAASGDSAQSLTFSGTTRRSLIAIAFTPVTPGGPPPTNNAPDAMTTANFTVAAAPTASANEFDLTVSTLPGNGGSALLALEYRVSTPAPGITTGWIELTGGPATGTRRITVPPAYADTNILVQVRAVNAIAPAADGDSRSVRLIYTAPTVVSDPDVVFTSQPGTYQIDLTARVSAVPVEFLVGELPSWITEDQLTNGRLIVDAMDPAGPVTVAVRAINSGGFVDLSFTVEVEAAPLNENTTTLFSSSKVRQPFTPYPTGTPLDATGFWLSFMFHKTEAGLGSNNVVSVIASATNRRHFSLGWDRWSFRSTSTGTFFGLGAQGNPGTEAFPVPDAGFHRALFWVRRDGTSNNMLVRMWRSDEEDARDATITTYLAMADFNELWVGGIGQWGMPNQDFNGRLYDIAFGRGNPAGLHLATREALGVDGAGFFFSDQYNWAADGNGATLQHAWRFSEYRAGAPFSPGPFAATDPGLADRIGSANAWIASGATVWSDTPPGAFPPFPQWAALPSLTVSGDTITLVPGSSVSFPAPTITYQALWNGNPVTLTGNSYTKTGAGQFVVLARASNIYGARSLVLQADLFGAWTGAGDDPAQTFTMRGIASDGAYWGFAANAQVGFFVGFNRSGTMVRDNNPQAIPYVVGSATVVSSWPLSELMPSGLWVNGAMYNTTIITGTSRQGPCQGFHGASGSYSASFDRARSLPLTLEPGTFFWKAISEPNAASAKDRMLRTVPLACVPTTPAWDCFWMSPINLGPTANAAKKLWRWSEVDETAHVALSTAASGASWSISDALLRRHWQRVRFEFAHNASRDWMLSNEGPRQYGRDMMSGASDGHCLLMSDQLTVAEKRVIACQIIRHGITLSDGYDEFIARTGEVPFRTDGGHNRGRVIPMIVGGHFLRNTTQGVYMRNFGVRFTDRTSSQVPQDYGSYRRVTQRVVDISNGAGDVAWTPHYGNVAPGVPYPNGAQGSADWNGNADDQTMNNDMQAHPYRTVANTALIAEMMMIWAYGLRAYYNHDAALDYLHRHILKDRAGTGFPDPWRFRGEATAQYAEAGRWGGSATSFSQEYRFLISTVGGITGWTGGTFANRRPIYGAVAL